MNNNNLILLAAMGVAVYFVMHSKQTLPANPGTMPASGSQQSAPQSTFDNILGMVTAGFEFGKTIAQPAPKTT